jgi:outer membrane lipoprotein SlyB
MGFIMFRIVLVLAAAATLVLAGCASSDPEKQELFRADDAKCKSYDAKPGTDAYVQCRLAIDIQRANTEAAAARTRP